VCFCFCFFSFLRCFSPVRVLPSFRQSRINLIGVWYSWVFTYCVCVYRYRYRIVSCCCIVIVLLFPPLFAPLSFFSCRCDHRTTNVTALLGGWLLWVLLLVRHTTHLTSPRHVTAVSLLHRHNSKGSNLIPCHFNIIDVSRLCWCAGRPQSCIVCSDQSYHFDCCVCYRLPPPHCHSLYFYCQHACLQPHSTATATATPVSVFARVVSPRRSLRACVLSGIQSQWSRPSRVLCRACRVSSQTRVPSISVLECSLNNDRYRASPDRLAGGSLHLSRRPDDRPRSDLI
jgi:hypothetical protein